MTYTSTLANTQRLIILGRLLRSGFPMNNASLLRRQYPLRIHFDTGKSSFRALTHGRTLVCLWIRIVAVSHVTFNRFELRRPDNTTLAVKWADFCTTHEKYCVHDHDREWYVDHQLGQILRAYVRYLPQKFMTYGDEIEGAIFGEIHERLGPNILLTFVDGFEREYLFPVTVPAPS